MGSVPNVLQKKEVTLAGGLRKQPVIPEHLASIVAKLQSSGSTEAADSDVLPRAAKRKRRAKEDRGLPEDEELRKLAELYLDQQRKLWPQLIGIDLLPDPTEAVITSMVEDLKQRHRKGIAATADRETLQRLFNGCSKKQSNQPELAGAYERFSCANSDPKSIADQLHEILRKAHSDHRFIPWALVFVDYAVSGLNRDRRGYTSYKAVLGDKNLQIKATYIDDFTRASRDELEWWQLAYLSKRLDKDLIGASDGFNLHNQDWEMQVSCYGMFSRLFIKSLIQKVRRGMGGTARKGGTLGLPPLGFTRRRLRGADGQVLTDSEGAPKTELCHDPDTKDTALLIWELAAVQGWSPYQITNLLNEKMIRGWNGWTEPGTRRILKNPVYIGVFIWGKTHREFDIEAKNWITVSNPRTQWKIRYRPDLALIPPEWWKKVRRRYGGLYGSSSGKTRARARRMATWLFHDTMVCGYCNNVIRLYRSTPKYRDLFCSNGPHQRHGCRLTTSKAISIVENCLLTYIRETLITEDSRKVLVEKANAYLREEASRPRADLAPLKKRDKELERSIDKLVAMVERHGDDAACERYHQRISELQAEHNDVRKRLNAAREAAKPPPADITADRVKMYLDDLRSVLMENLPVSAELLRTLTGPIKVTQEEVPGRKRGAKWIAIFSPNLMALLARVAAEKNYPDSITLEYLSTRIWINPENVSVAIHKVPRYEELAPQIAELYGRVGKR